MQFGRALVGAVIGAAVGIAVLLGAYFFLGWEYTWLAVLVAALVGAGVRTLVATKGHASYARGALTALVALAAFVGGQNLIVAVATRQAARVSMPERPTPSSTDSDASDDQTGGGEVEAELPEQPIVVEPAGGAAGKIRMRNGYSTWDFIWLSVAALVAYELGRGSGMPTSTVTASQEPADPATTA